MGGMIAQELAARDPGPGGRPRAAVDRRRRTRRRAGAGGHLGPAGRPQRDARVQQATRLLSLLFPPAVAADVDRLFGEVVAEARAGLSPDVLTAQERALEALARRRHRRGRRRLPDPCPPDLVVDGDRGRGHPAGQRRAPRRPVGEPTRSCGTTGAGHAVMAQEPDALAGVIGEFLDRHP